MKLVLVTPGLTTTSHDAVFGDPGTLVDPEADAARVPARGAVHSAPEPACRQLVTALPGLRGAGAPAVDDLRGPDFGAWQGLPLREVFERDPAGLQEWLRDPDACPHGGESLAAHLARVAALLDSYPWPPEGVVVVVPTLTARAACVHALGAGPGSLAHLDIAPGTVARVSLNAETWRLQSLVPSRTVTG